MPSQPPAPSDPAVTVAQEDKLGVNVAVQAAGTMFNALAGLLVLLVLGRVLGAERFGDYVAVLSAAVVALTLLEGGWPTRVYRDSAGEGLELRSHNMIATSSGYVLIVTTVLALLIALFAPDRLEYFAALACMALVAIMNLVSARMRARGRFFLESGWQVSGRLASGVLILLGAIWLSSALTSIFLYWAAGLALVVVVLGRRWLAAPSLRDVVASLPLMAPFLMIDLLGALLLKGDVAIVGWAGASGEPLSFYAACTRLNEAALLLFAPVGNVLLRSLRINKDDHLAFRGLWRRGVGLGLIAGSAAVLGSVLLGEALMALLFGPTFAAAGQLLPYTASMLPFALGNLVLAQAILARGGERLLALALIPVSLILAAAMIGGWRFAGAQGAALGLALTHVLLWGGMLYWLSRAGESGEHPAQNLSDA